MTLLELCVVRDRYRFVPVGTELEVPPREPSPDPQ